VQRGPTAISGTRGGLDEPTLSQCYAYDARSILSQASFRGYTILLSVPEYALNPALNRL